jgi:hypothetical protein
MQTHGLISQLQKGSSLVDGPFFLLAAKRLDVSAAILYAASGDKVSKIW